MFKHLVIGATVALLPLSARSADVPKPALPTPPNIDQQVEQTQMRLYAAQADHYLALAKKFQSEAIEGAKRSATVDAWWSAWWKGMFPEVAKSAPAADTNDQ